MPGRAFGNSYPMGQRASQEIKTSNVLPNSSDSLPHFRLNVKTTNSLVPGSKRTTIGLTGVGQYSGVLKVCYSGRNYF
jgi:hypothetical protein